MSESANHSAIPRATIHKRILDAAEDQPTASMENLAGQIPAATTDLVERVLDEYGDPASDDESEATESSDSPMAKKSIHPNTTDPTGQSQHTTDVSISTAPDQKPTEPDDFSEKEFETLRAIHDHPEKSQRELAEILGISGATVSTRVSGIEGFEWANRKEYAEDLFGEAELVADTEDSSASETTMNQAESINQFAESLVNLEQQVDRLAKADRTSPLDDPELVHKVVHACLESETISKDEELAILQDVLG